MASIKTYKALVDQIIAIKTQDDIDKASAAIDNAYQHGEKITAADNTQLYRLLSRISATVWDCEEVRA